MMLGTGVSSLSLWPLVGLQSILAALLNPNQALEDPSEVLGIPGENGFCTMLPVELHSLYHL